MPNMINTSPEHSNGGGRKTDRTKKTTKRRLNLGRIGLVLSFVFVLAGTTRFCADKIGLYKQSREQQKIENLKKLQDEAETKRVDRIKNSKVVYLTFDDGPGNNTQKILDVLKKNNIKATFFVVGDMVNNRKDLAKKIYDEGHTIANHTYSHKYTYSSKEVFLSDVQKTDDVISDALGLKYRSEMVRIPGGSMYKKSEKEAAKENNYKIIDWTAITGDSEKANVSKEYVMGRVKQTLGDNQYEVLLMHDIKNVTVDTLQQVIDYAKSQGYIFEPLVSDSPVQFN